MGTFGVTGRPFLEWRRSCYCYTWGQVVSPLVGYLPLVSPVQELQDCHYAPLETRSAVPTAAQYMWLVLREWPSKVSNDWELY